jgi:isoleucyl-tRNA synthetase
MGTVLATLDLLLHPVSPLLTEFLFQEVFSRSAWDEPLLLQTPIRLRLRKSDLEDMKVVESVLQVESACNSARMKAKLKRRWPVRRLVVLSEPGEVARLKKGRTLLASLCNVKEVAFKTGLEAMPVTVSFLPIRSQIGAQFKERSGQILNKLPAMKGKRAWETYKSGKPIMVQLGRERVEVSPAAFELDLRGVGKWEASVRGRALVALEKVRDDRLVAEGIVRDLARRLQALRKKRGRDPTEMLRRARVAGLNDETLRLVEPLQKELAFLVRAERVEVLGTRTEEGSWEEEEFDGNVVYLDIE